MSKRNELPILIAALVSTLVILGGGALFFLNQFTKERGGSTAGREDTPALPRGAERSDIAKADGRAGVSVIPGELPPANKQQGLEAFAAGDYGIAQTAFETALRQTPNDPEALIYLNNAKIGDEASYDIALVVPAGNDENAAKELMRGAAQAQLEINTSGGIGGTPLRVLIVDDSDDKAIAKDVAERLVKADNVLGVIGHFSSGTTLAATETYQTGQLPMISPTSTSVEISNAGDYIFRTVPSDRLAASTLASYALETLNVTKAAVFYNGSNAYSKSVQSQFSQELASDGGEVVAQFDIQEPGFSVDEAFRTLQEGGAEVIMMGLTLDPLDVPLEIIAANGRSLPLLGSDALYSPRILKLGADDALGLTVAVPWHILSHQQSSFVERSQALWNADVNWRTVTAYDAVKTLAAGLETSPTREGLAAAIGESQFRVEGATGLVKFFRETGDRNQPSQLVSVVEGSRAGGSYTFKPVE